MSLRVALLFTKAAYVKRPVDVLFCRQLASHAAGNEVLLRTPVYLQHKMRQLRRKLLEADRAQVQRRSRLGNVRRPVVSCRRPQCNWNWGQTTADQPLASAGWARARSHGDHFTVRRLAHAPPPLEAGPFPDWLDPRLVAALGARGICQPSPVQSECLEVLWRERERPVLCLSEAGSGKTLAFLLPLLQGLLEDGGQGQALVVAPSRELAAQLAREARSLAQACGLGARLLLAARGRSRRPSGEEEDRLLVSTPGGLNRVDLRRVGRLVLDEVDTLLDDSFRPAALHIAQSVRPGAQLVLVGAARPSWASLEELLAGAGAGGPEELVRVTSAQLHRLLPHVEHRLMRVRPAAKAGALVELVKRHSGPQLVFANSGAGCRWLADLLRAQGIQAACLHADLTAQERRREYGRFASGEAPVLVCTDVAAKGLDTTRAQQVVNFELPARAADYLHRAGRVGRLQGASHARVLSLVASRRDARLAQSIERAAREAHPVEEREDPR